jgi:signal transduction histidine kinase
VNNILTFVKFEKVEGAQLEKAPVNLAELIDDTVRCFQCTADARRVSLMSFVDPSVRAINFQGVSY